MTSSFRNNIILHNRPGTLINIVFTEHSSILCSQRTPSQPLVQLHVYILTSSIHSPPLKHGLLCNRNKYNNSVYLQYHNSVYLQYNNSIYLQYNNSVYLQSNNSDYTDLRHSSILMSQCVPFQPHLHEHQYPLTPSIQSPSLIQGSL